MKAKYLSQAQAHAMCRDYQHLRGQALQAGRNIDYVCVVPYRPTLQWEYVQALLEENTTSRPFSLQNPASRFQVLLVSKAADREYGFVAEDLRSYLAAHGMPIEDGRYACLRSTSINMDAPFRMAS